MEKEKKKIKNILKCVEIENGHPAMYRLNEEGKRDLAHDIIEEVSIEEVNNFIKKFGYSKKL